MEVGSAKGEAATQTGEEWVRHCGWTAEPRALFGGSPPLSLCRPHTHQTPRLLIDGSMYKITGDRTVVLMHANISGFQSASYFF